MSLKPPKPTEDSPFVLRLDEPDALAWDRVFGNQRPVELEIGTGKAGHLLRRAQAHPERNFVGIEWANKFYRYAADRLRRWNVTNARMLRTDAAHFIRVVCPRDSLSVLHVYHPDPWPKKRHHKRRLIQKVFVEAAVDCLVAGGHWAVQTDHAEYFEAIGAVLRAHPELLEVPFEDAELDIGAGRVATNFEIKYREEAREIYQIAMKKRRQHPGGVAPRWTS